MSFNLIPAIFTGSFQKDADEKTEDPVCQITCDADGEDADDDLVGPGHLLGKQDHVPQTGGRCDHLRTDDSALAVAQTDAHSYENVRHGVGQHDAEKFLAFCVAKHGSNLQKLPVTARKSLDDV